MFRPVHLPEIINFNKVFFIFLVENERSRIMLGLWIQLALRASTIYTVGPMFSSRSLSCFFP